MSESSISEVARYLIEARRDHRQWDASAAAPLNDAGEAYAVQDLVMGGLDADLGGWKTSAPDPHSVPITAPIYSALLHRTGTQVPASQLFVIGIEGEIAFRMKRDLPPLGRPYSREDLLAAVGEMLPAIEIVDTRMTNGLEESRHLILADNQSNGGLVIGPGIANWRNLDLSRQPASVTVNGQVKYSGIAANRAGDLFRLMAWAADHCATRKRPIRAGDIITTGTYTGMILVEPGAEVVVEFPEIGRVEVSFPVGPEIPGRVGY
ncbi:MAG: fumarylacetoacetate hydrolase family protein [Alphaproteobacteria bacterium]|nr:fumarylacetoacetate hydrolase family protein [Alphaproteobacteria bacterium]